MKDISLIETFGAIDADSDDLLLKVFEDHEAYKSILECKNYLIIGRKGTGKTAIFKKLLTLPKEKYLTFGHTFADYPWHYHDRQKMQGVPEHEKYVNSWKYLLLMTLSKIILNYDMSLSYDNDPQVSDNLAKIEQFVIDSYGTRDPDLTQLFTPSRKIRLKPYFNITAIPGVKAGITPEAIGVDQLPAIFAEINRNLSEYVLTSLNPENTYFVAFDQLDLGFNPTDDEYVNRIIGLLLAARDINLLAKTYNKKFLAVVFLRDDIYENQEMTGRQSKYQHMLDRTFLRPRDMIQFCNEVLSQYKLHKGDREATHNGNMFSNVHVNLAKPEYSNYFYEELDDEIYKHIPSYRDYFEVFKTVGCLQFKREDFLAAFERRKDLFPNVENPMKILQELYEFSVVGFYRAGGRGYGGSEYVYKYKDSRAQFDFSADSYRVHPGLMEALGLKKYPRSS